LRLEAEGLLNLVSAPAALQDSKATVGNLVAAELGGLVSKKLFGLKRPGQRFVRQLSNQSRANQRKQLQESSRSRAMNILSQVEVELHGLRGEVQESSRRRLLSSLDPARSSTRAAVIARRTIQVITRIEALQTPTSSVSIPRSSKTALQSETEDHSVLRSLEQALRAFISGQLSTQSPTWWTDRIPDQVRLQAEGRLARREKTWPWTPGIESAPIHYVDFADYARIIADARNWDPVFRPFFLDLELVRSKLRELEPIRNDIAHSRPVSSEGRIKLRLYAGELLRLMKFPGAS
jgi:HEPN superfamily Swt1-like protein